MFAGWISEQKPRPCLLFLQGHTNCLQPSLLSTLGLLPPSPELPLLLKDNCKVFILDRTKCAVWKWGENDKQQRASWQSLAVLAYFSCQAKMARFLAPSEYYASLYITMSSSYAISSVSVQDICLATCLIAYSKVGSKWIEDVNVRPDIIKVLEENIKEKLLDIGFSNGFLNIIPKTQTTSN